MLFSLILPYCIYSDKSKEVKKQYSSTRVTVPRLYKEIALYILILGGAEISAGV